MTLHHLPLTRPIARPLRAAHGAGALAGETILVVDDSRFTREGLALLGRAAGARVRGADSLAAARRHLACYRPSVLIVDLGLPDGSGTELIAEVAPLPSAPLILALSGEADPALRSAARAAGAAGFLLKPIAGTGAFQQAVLAHLPGEQMPRIIPARAACPDPSALAADLGRARALLAAAGGDPVVLRAAAQFAASLAAEMRDDEMAGLAQRLARGAAGGGLGLCALDAALAARAAQCTAPYASVSPGG